MATIVFENKNYKIETTEDKMGYNLINKATDTVERSREGLLPNLLFLAVDLDKALEEFQAEQDRAAQQILVPDQKLVLPN